MVPLHKERFLVVHLYSSFSMYPLDFFLRGKFIPKFAILGDVGDCKATFLKPKSESYHDCGYVGDPSSRQIL